ncbi:SDR family oxidoreductase [uncultured Vibrio sp.]|uniref:SDR family NAD(P)-dependent oxidoreductase n=1 Tax=uncultured Vibrio sp. TaxID=114054 RepID=UPI0025D8CEC8|nr:SDR family oxidoreductase [uncultured Vibrio sp.]
MKVAIFGASSRLSIELMNRLSELDVTSYGRSAGDVFFDAEDISLLAMEKLFKSRQDVYIFNLGLLQGVRILDQTTDDMYKSLCVNALFSIKSCEYILKHNPNARIFIIGSESGKKGSYDTSYFLAKSMLRAYVKERKLSSPNQQLLLISPSTIEDGKMTTDRTDIELLSNYKEAHPKKRFLSSEEVSNFIYDIITNESTYLCNTEIELNGGKFARMAY